MNKSELTAALAKAANLSIKDARAAIACLFETHPRRGLIARALDAGQRVTVAGFGTFEMRSRRSRSGRNPRTGQTMTIAATCYPAFRAGLSLKPRQAKPRR